MDNKFDIFNTDFWAITKKIEIDFSIGSRRKNGKIKDHQLLEEIKKNQSERHYSYIYRWIKSRGIYCNRSIVS